MELTLPPNVRLTLAVAARERAVATAYIERIMRERFGGRAPPTAGVIITALFRGRLVGTIALEGSRNDEPFPIEAHYQFTADTPFPCSRAHIMQGSRWVATKAGVSGPLVEAALELGYQLGKCYMLIEAKPYSIARLAELGIPCIPIPGAHLSLEQALSQVGEEGMPYYRTPPLPQPYLIECKTALR